MHQCLCHVMARETRNSEGMYGMAGKMVGKAGKNRLVKVKVLR